MIDNDYLGDTKLFQYPLALQKLGLFTMDVYKAQRKKSHARPLVMCVSDNKRGITIVLAVMGTKNEDNSRK